MPDTPVNDNDRELSVDEKINFPIHGRVAVYDNLRSIPRVMDFEYPAIRDFIDEVPQKIYSISHDLGGKIPYTILKEVIENLIHADFKDIIVTIMNDGNNIIISDQGPGIPDKNRAFMPGYTSATSSMKKYIRGVGSGLPIIKETIVFSGGSVDVDSNIKRGTVVSLKIASRNESQAEPALSAGQLAVMQNSGNRTTNVSYSDTDISGSSNISKQNIQKSAAVSEQDVQNVKLSIRQKKILSLMLELEESGPAKIAKELGFSLSTSYRELIFLEKLKFLSLTESGKRSLTPKGKKYLEYYSNSF